MREYLLKNYPFLLVEPFHRQTHLLVIRDKYIPLLMSQVWLIHP